MSEQAVVTEETDEEVFQRRSRWYHIRIAILRTTRPNDDPELNRLLTTLTHCEWRRDNQNHPHPSRESRT